MLPHEGCYSDFKDPQSNIHFSYPFKIKEQSRVHEECPNEILAVDHIVKSINVRHLKM